MFAPRVSIEAANAAADAVCSLLDLGYLRLHGGAQPPTADSPSSAPVLAELRFGSPAFAPADNGVCVANAITKCSDNLATGSATWFTCVKADGVSPVFDGSVGVSDADLVMAATQIVQHAQTTCSGLTYTHNKG